MSNRPCRTSVRPASDADAEAQLADYLAGYADGAAEPRLDREGNRIRRGHGF